MKIPLSHQVELQFRTFKICEKGLIEKLKHILTYILFNCLISITKYNVFEHFTFWVLNFLIVSTIHLKPFNIGLVKVQTQTLSKNYICLFSIVCLHLAT